MRLTDRVRRGQAGWLGSPHLAIGLSVVLLLAAGVALGRHYGPSWDEGNTVPFGKEMLSAYIQLRPPPDWEGIITLYGPVYFAFTEAIVSFGRYLVTTWRPAELRHLVYFLSLPIGMVSIYALASRWTSRLAALTTALLFATQPLFWGHAFINPKDLPFLAFFALSLALGMRVVEQLDQRGVWWTRPGGEGRAAWSEFGRAFVKGLTAAPWTTRALVLGLLIFGFVLAAEVLATRKFLLPSLLDIVGQAYRHQAWEPINDLFSRVAERAEVLPLSSYLAKVSTLYIMFSRPVVALGFLPGVLVLAGAARPSLKLLRPRGLPTKILLAATVLGIATSIRLAAPLAGVIVTTLMLVRARKSSSIALAAYWATFGLVTYLTWPYLWGDPLGRLLQSYDGLLHLETDTPVLFQGMIYQGSTLPWYFAPRILILQITEPALFLAMAGLVVALRKALRRQLPTTNLVAMLAWIGLPLGLAMASVSAHYDNARQYFFALPPIFLLSALMIDSMFERVHGQVARLVALTVMLMPGVISIIRLHPYEYIYYNSLAGGTSGANRRFETDYWAISYREGANVLNEVAPLESSVFILGPWEGVAEFLRPDISIYDPVDDAFDPALADYLLVTTRANLDLSYRAWADVVASIQADGAELAHVLRNPAGD